MSSELSRFGVAMDRSLLERFDQVVRERGSTRSSVLSDLARAEVVRALIRKPVQAVGTLTIIYDHHVRDLSERLTEMQHELGEKVHSTMHIHLDHDRCLEVIVLRGRADLLRSAADRLIATRGVMHGSLELFADTRETDAHEPPSTGPPPSVRDHAPTHSHAPAHGHAPTHSHAPAHGHAHAPAREHPRDAPSTAVPRRSTRPSQKRKNLRAR